MLEERLQELQIIVEQALKPLPNIECSLRNLVLAIMEIQINAKSIETYMRRLYANEWRINARFVPDENLYRENPRSQHGSYRRICERVAHHFQELLKVPENLAEDKDSWTPCMVRMYD